MSKLLNIREDLFIPHEIVKDILYHLPVESLIRFKRVCKLWHETISHKDFVRSNTCNKPKFVAMFSLNNSVDFKIINPENDRITKYKYLRRRDNKTKGYSQENRDELRYDEVMVNSCNGLLLVIVNDVFYLHNPLTRVAVKVLENLPLYDIKIRNKRCHHSIIGFCHDSRKDEYKVLVMAYLHRDVDTGGRYNSRPLILVAGLKEKRWKEIRSPFDDHYSTRVVGVNIFNGMLHGVFTYLSVLPLRGVQVLMSYNPQTDEFQELPIPECADNEIGTTEHSPSIEIVALLTIGGRLCVLLWKRAIGGINSFELARMNEYGVKDSWARMFVLKNPLYGIMGDYRFGHDLRYGDLKLMINGGIVVIVSNPGHNIYTYDRNTETRYKSIDNNDIRDIIEFRKGYISTRVNAVEYVESLVTPIGYGWSRERHEELSRFENISFLEGPNNRFYMKQKRKIDFI